MPDYINGILDEVPNDMQGTAVTPTAANLFMVRDDIEKLDDKHAETYQVKFLMPDYINGILDEVPNDMQGTAVTPTAANLFMVRDDIEKLDDKHAETYHHLMAKLLYLCKRAHPDLQTVVSFLMMQVTQPDEYDWKKLAQCI
jgi:hypothetical protein